MMKIAFATIFNVRDIRKGSGTFYYLWQALLKEGVEVILIGPLNVEFPLLTRFFKRLSRVSGKRYLSYRDPFVARKLGKLVEKRLEGTDYDLVLTTDYSIAGYTKTTKPIILYTDDIFPKDYSTNIHPRLENLSKFSVLFSHWTTCQGLKNVTYCIFASHHAKDLASEYKLPGHADYSVIPFGANIEQPSQYPIRSMEKINKKGRIDLLFIGKDWCQKGGAIAVQTANLLNSKNVNAHLHVVGVDLSETITEDWVTFWGLLNKDILSEKEQLKKLYETCDVLVVPSKAEGFGIVFVEAAAYGIPSLAYESTGVKTAIKNGVSGILLKPEEGAEGFADLIIDWWGNPVSYNILSKSSINFFEEYGNWEIATRKLLQEINHLSKQSVA